MLTSGDHSVEIRRICGQTHFAHYAAPAYHTLAFDAVVLCILGYFLLRDKERKSLKVNYLLEWSTCWSEMTTQDVKSSVRISTLYLRIVQSKKPICHYACTQYSTTTKQLKK